MSQVVAVHGFGQQYKSSDFLEHEWLPSILSGLRLAGVDDVPAVQISCAFYGHLFRPPATGPFVEDNSPRVKRPHVDPGVNSVPIGGRQVEYPASELPSSFEQDLLHAWRQHAADIDKSVRRIDRVSNARRRRSLRPVRPVQRAIEALTRSTLTAGILSRALPKDAKQLSIYFGDPDLRVAAREVVASAITEDTRVVVAHSLGGVVAYEALCANPPWPVTTFITLGTPLGIRNLVFDRLDPPPRNGAGMWPSAVTRWCNIVDPRDIIALGQELRPLFGERVEDFFVDNGARPHEVSRYLSTQEVGRSIAMVL